MFSILRGCFCVYRRTETCWRTKGVTTALQRKYAAYSVLFQSGLPLKLHSSKGSFRQKARLSLLSIPVWLRCRQRGQPEGLPSVALPESTPRCSRCLRPLGYRHGPTGRPSGRSSRRASPCSALEQFQSEIALTGALHSLLVVFGSVGLSRSRAFVL